MRARKPLKITSRTSSVTNGFVQAILPDSVVTQIDLDQIRIQVGQADGPLECVYCGRPATDWDHLRPLVSGKRPTGFLNEARNLVPSCGPCNQSKGGQEWRRWMMGTAIGSPKNKDVADVDTRVSLLERFERWGNAAPVDFVSIVGPDLWDRYWDKLEEIERLMHAAQIDADVIKRMIAERLSEST